ncbi:hypothetical protein V9T40_006214 [Parthenolecanium corni]|uniref:Uncharacterized protein n=1 Tax=Parthenolecanium corni TaxID=536013 RepID=A0AAN9Y9C1_9HEMI
MCGRVRAIIFIVGFAWMAMLTSTLAPSTTGRVTTNGTVTAHCDLDTLKQCRCNDQANPTEVICHSVGFIEFPVGLPSSILKL